jgi:hypothetical protein
MSKRLTDNCTRIRQTTVHGEISGKDQPKEEKSPITKDRSEVNDLGDTEGREEPDHKGSFGGQ